MTSDSMQALLALISKLEDIPLRMGRGDHEREALVVKLRQVANGSQELSLPDLYLAVRVLGAEGQNIVREIFAAIAASEAAVLELSSYAVPQDDNVIDNLARNLTALELPFKDSHARSRVVHNIEAYMDNKASTLGLVDMLEAARLLREQGNEAVEHVLRKVLISHMNNAAEKLWSKVAAHFEIFANPSVYLRGEVLFPRRSGSKTRQMINVLPHIDNVYHAVSHLDLSGEVTDIDDVVNGVFRKLEFIDESEAAAELEDAFDLWSRFKAACRAL